MSGLLAVDEMRGAGAPTVLLAYQQRWIADRSEVKVVEKSRRIGLTWGQASDDVLTAATGGRDGMDVLYISYNQDMTREYVDTCAFWARHFNRACSGIKEFMFADDDPDREIKAYRIDFASGHKIMALSNRPTNLRGKQGRVVIDEAAFVEDLDGLIKAALALCMWGGQVVIVSTHNGDDNYFNQIVQEIRAGRSPYALHRITLDDALAEGLFRRICLVRGQPWTPEAEAAWRDKIVAQYKDHADEELFCIPSQGGGAYFTLNLIEACASPEIPVLLWTPPASDFVDWSDDRRFREVETWCREELAPALDKLPQDKRHWLGEDFGRDQDLTVLWPLSERPGPAWWTPFVLELRDCPFTQQEQILKYVCDRLPKFSGAALDKTGNGQFLAERARQLYGEDRVAQVSISTTWYLENMPPARAALEDRTVSLPQDELIIGDLRAIKKIKGVPRPPDTRTDSRDKGRRHADSAVAFVLAVFAARRFEGGDPFSVAGIIPRQSASLFRGY